MNTKTKRIKSTDLLTIYPTDAPLEKLFLILISPFTYWGITRYEYISTTNAHLYDYCVWGNLHTWVFILTYPIQLLVMLATCIWDGGLRECYLPNRTRIHWTRVEWTDEEENPTTLKYLLYQNVKKLWERA